MLDPAAIEEMRKARFRFLLRLYTVTGGDELRVANMFDLGKDIGLSPDQTTGVYQYLRGEGLVKARGIGGLIGLTHEGVVEIENSISNPQQPTQHFPAMSLVVVGQMIGSQIQQVVGPVTQTALIQTERLNELREILAGLEASVAELGIEPKRQSDLLAEIRTLNAQLQSSKPETSVIMRGLASIRRILEGAAGSALGGVILGRILVWLVAVGWVH